MFTTTMNSMNILKVFKSKFMLIRLKRCWVQIKGWEPSGQVAWKAVARSAANCLSFKLKQLRNGRAAAQRPGSLHHESHAWETDTLTLTLTHVHIYFIYLYDILYFLIIFIGLQFVLCTQGRRMRALSCWAGLAPGWSLHLPCLLAAASPRPTHRRKSWRCD